MGCVPFSWGRPDKRPQGAREAESFLFALRCRCGAAEDDDADHGRLLRRQFGHNAVSTGRPKCVCSNNALDINEQGAYSLNQDPIARWRNAIRDGGRQEERRTLSPAIRSVAVAARMTDETVTALLERLSSGRVDAAWGEFLARYSPLIMHVVRRYESDHDRSSDCFVHACGALSDDGFRRLCSFRPDGPARFRTWLMAVVAHLCIDWRRKEQGRVRPFRSISRLPEIEHQVYRCIYERGMTRAQCLETLAPRFAGLTEATVSEINARLFASLTPHQRWQLSVRKPALHPVPIGGGPDEEDAAAQVATTAPGPDERAAESQDAERLQDALAKLPAEQRLLLRLRYEQNLTLAEVARLTGQPDPFRANRRIEAALDALAELMGERRERSDRKTN